MRVLKSAKNVDIFLVQDIEKEATAIALGSGLNEMYFTSLCWSLDAKRSMSGLPNLHTIY